MVYPNRKDLEILNKFISSLFGEKINKVRAKQKILRLISRAGLSITEDVDTIVEEYVKHLNTSNFTALGKRMHLFMCYISLKQGGGFLKHYEKQDGDFKDPLFVVGLPRSGTTNLHNLFIEELGYNGLRYWQLASPSRRVRNYKLDSLLRRSQTNLVFSIFKYLVPSIQEMHHVNMDTYEECWHFHKNIFLCYNYVIQTDFQKLEDYLLSNDSSFILSAYKKFLSSNEQFLSKPFALKCPEYLLFLHDINKIFPKSKVVWIHRDPLDAILSYCPMIDNSWEFFRGETSKIEVSNYIINLYKKMLKKAIDDRKMLNTCFYDVRYKDLIQERENLIGNLKDDFKCYPQDEKPKKTSFYMNKHKFDASEYQISEQKIKDEFSFYYDEYGVYL